MIRFLGGCNVCSYFFLILFQLNVNRISMGLPRCSTDFQHDGCLRLVICMVLMLIYGDTWGEPSRGNYIEILSISLNAWNT